MADITFAIGDVHGCLTKLEALVSRCRNYARGAPCKFILLGDYIDRGPDSRGVVALARHMESHGQAICLKGNHEAILLHVIDFPDDIMWWIDNGGGVTLESYGVASIGQLPPDDLDWMRNLPLFKDDGLRFFVHAGIDPRLPFDHQKERTMLWSREFFVFDPGRFIVHGHTPLRSRFPEVHPYRLNLDTGAVYGGPLSAAAFVSGNATPIALIVGDDIIEEL
jgi:serine/threonine protein phosphatase 1